MKKKFIVINMNTTANNLMDTREEAVALAKQKTMSEPKTGPSVYGVFELVLVTVVPIPDVKTEEVN